MKKEKTMKKSFIIIMSVALILALNGCLNKRVIEESNAVPLTPVPGISEHIEIPAEEQPSQEDYPEEKIPFNEEIYETENPEEDDLPEKITETSGKAAVYYFWGDGCPQCTTQGKFLDEIQEKYPEIDIKRFETWRNRENYQIFLKVAEAYGFSPRGVPTTFIGDRHWVGFSSAYGSQMEQAIIGCIEHGCKSPGQKASLY